ncbi:MAG: NTP transferase domain-containing protein [Planctomycetes bacterium]|nr:NTP transferase domain-containing protein [Planctomycetota bacterium]
MSGRIVLRGPFGFIGAAFRRALVRAGAVFEVLTRDDPDAAAPGPVDLFLDAAGNSRKYLAESDPEFDRRSNVEAVAANLRRFRPRRYVLLSSSAVYADPSAAAAAREVEVPEGRVSVYGAHKREAEQQVRAACPCPLLLRPAGFFGPGLTKGPVYDLLEARAPHVSPASRMQLLDVDAFAEAALRLAETGGTMNAVPRESVRLDEALPAEAAAQRARFEMAGLPVLEFALEGARFGAALAPGSGGPEALARFAARYRRLEAHAAVTVLVLAGGRGTRLPGPVPKLVRTVAGASLLHHVTAPFATASYARFVVLLGHEAPQIEAALAGDPVLAGAERLVEDTPLGTGGAVRRALERIDGETFLLVNGDTLLAGVDLEALVKRHLRTEATVTLLAAPVPDAAPFGRLTIAPDGRLEAFAEKAAPGPGVVYAGCAVLDRARFLAGTAGAAGASFERGLLVQLARAGAVHAMRQRELSFVDAGTPAGLAAAARLLEGTRPCSS